MAAPGSAVVRDICYRALKEIGAYSVGETPSSADTDTALEAFQGQIDAWNADHLTLNIFQRITDTLIAGTQTKTIGATGQIVATRPVDITAINYIVPGSSPNVETPMGKMDDDSYLNLSIKTLSSNLPTQWWYNPTFPNGTLTFWPVESQNVTIAIYYDLPAAVPATLDTSMTGPPGYYEAFVYQLAIRLLGPFGKNPAAVPLLPELASQAFARMKRPNTQPGLLGVDSALNPMGGYGYNILNDSQAAAGSR